MHSTIHDSHIWSHLCLQVIHIFKTVMCFYGTFVFPDVFLTNQEQRLRHKESRFLLSTLLQYTFTKTRAVCFQEHSGERCWDFQREGKVSCSDTHVFIFAAYAVMSLLLNLFMLCLYYLQEVDSLVTFFLICCLAGSRAHRRKCRSHQLCC